VVAVFSVKGGSGATTIATNLAGSLLGRETGTPRSAVLCDLDFQMGDVLAFLDVVSRYSWKDLVQNFYRLDHDLLLQSLTVHPSGLRVLSQTDRPEDGDDIEVDVLMDAVTLLRRHFDFVIVDGLRDFRETSLAILDAADTVLVVATQDVPALKNANRSLSILKRLGYDRGTVRLVLNRYSKEGVDRGAVADALGVEVSAVVSNDFPTVVRAINEGKLLDDLAPKARVTRDIAGLVSLVQGAPAEAQPETRGLFARWRKA